LEKKLDCMAKILFGRIILLGNNHQRIDRFWEELVHDLLLGSFILACWSMFLNSKKE